MKTILIVMFIAFLSVTQTSCTWVKGKVESIGHLFSEETKQEVASSQEILEQFTCEALGAKDCLEIGEKLLAKKDELSTARALAFFITACDKGSAIGCGQAAIRYQDANKTQEAAVKFIKACELDSHTGCYDAAVAFLDGIGVESDVEKAKTYFGFACKDSVNGEHRGEACTKLGMLLVDTYKTDQTQTKLLFKAFDYFLEGCRGQYSEGCFLAAEGYRRGEGVAGSEEFARQYYATGCDQKLGKSCYWAGKLNAGSNPATATQYYFTGCSYNNVASCFQLAERYRLGKAAAQNDRLAELTYRQICSAWLPAACYWAAKLQESKLSGESPPKQEALSKIQNNYEKACKAKLSLGCYRLAVMILGNKEPDLAAAAGYLKPGCSGNEWIGCYQLARLAEQGAVTEPTAAALYQQVCDATTLQPITIDLRHDAMRVAEEARWQPKACLKFAELSVVSDNPDPTIAFSYIRRACTNPLTRAADSDLLLYSKACYKLANAYQYGTGTKPNISSAALNYSNVCNLEGDSIDNTTGDPILKSDGPEPWRAQACLALAIIHDKPLVALQNAALAFSYYKRACQYGQATVKKVVLDANTEREVVLRKTLAAACYNLAVSYRDGLGTETDISMANALFDYSCILGQARACFNYALFLTTQENQVTAVQSLFIKACDLGLQDACNNACNQGVQEACKPVRAKQ